MFSTLYVRTSHYFIIVEKPSPIEPLNMKILRLRQLVIIMDNHINLQDILCYDYQSNEIVSEAPGNQKSGIEPKAHSHLVQFFVNFDHPYNCSVSCCPLYQI